MNCFPVGVRKRSKGRKESEVSASIQAYLAMRNDIFWWRANTSAGMAPSGQYMRSGMKGQADIQGVQACVVPSWIQPRENEIFGRFIAIEVKREKGGKVSAEQERWGANVMNHGGLYIVARGAGDVEDALGTERVKISKLTHVRTYPK